MRSCALGSTLFLLVQLSLFGCSGDPGATTRTEIQDSAGVRIVLNPPQAGMTHQQFSLSPEPTLAIGKSGEEMYEFFRVVTVIGLPGGGTAVADGMSREIRFFNSGGEFVRLVGGRGDGPGEFRSISWIQRMPGDSLAAYDNAANRLTFIPVEVEDVSGSFVTFPINPPPLGAAPQGTLVSGPGTVRSLLPGDRYLMAGAAHMVSGGGAGFRRLPVALISADADLQFVDTLQVIDAWDFYETGTGEFPGYRPVPFGRLFATAATDDGVYVTDGTSYQIDFFTLDGTYVRSIREDQVPKSVGEAEMSAYVTSLGDRAPADLSDLPFPENYPAFSALLVDDSGHLWAKEYSVPGALSEIWHVFDPEGSLRSVMRGPAGFSIKDVFDGRVFGVSTDSLDIETIEVYGLNRSGS